jgi:phage repressor protein C with HTH and peptisase S24 domain
MIRGSVSREAFAARFGVHRNTLARWETGMRVPDLDFVRDIAAAFNIEPEWVLFGSGAMHRDPEGRAAMPPCRAEDAADSGGLVLVPKVKARLASGAVGLEMGGEIKGTHAFRSAWLNRKGRASRMVLMDVTGDSMEPEIRGGDTVLIDQGQTEVIPGGFYAVGIEDGVVVRQLDLKPGVLVLTCPNPRYGPIEVDVRGGLGGTVRIIGRVIWWCREAR